MLLLSRALRHLANAIDCQQHVELIHKETAIIQTWTWRGRTPKTRGSIDRRSMKRKRMRRRVVQLQLLMTPLHRPRLTRTTLWLPKAHHLQPLMRLNLLQEQLLLPPQSTTTAAHDKQAASLGKRKELQEQEEEATTT